MWAVHAIAQDVNVTLGSQTASFTGTGTISAANSSSVVGTGTLFTTEVQVGDTFTAAGAAHLVTAITDNTHLTMDVTTTVTAGSSFTIQRHALAIKSTGTWTISAGKTLTVRGGLHLNGALVGTAGSIVLQFDGSVNNYSIYGAPSSQTSYIFNFAGSVGARNTLTATGGGYFTFPTGNGKLTLGYTDVSNCGTSSVSCFGAGAASGYKVDMQHNTFANSGVVFLGTPTNINAAADLLFNDNVLLSLPAGLPAQTLYNWLVISANAATTGQRQFHRNMLAVPDQEASVSINSSQGFGTLDGNVFNRLTSAGAGTAPFATFSDNLYYMRMESPGITNFTGSAGDTHDHQYLFNDMGLNQLSANVFMSVDSGGGTGTWTLQYHILDQPGVFNSQLTHPNGAPTLAWVMALNHVLAIPTAAGVGPADIHHRGTSNTTTTISHVTSMLDRGGVTTGVTGGLIHAGDSTPAKTNLIDRMQDVLGWAKREWVSTGVAGTFGYLASYQQATPVSNLVNVSNVSNNALYNATVGSITDAAGANSTSLLGWQGWRLATKPTTASQIDLGQGTDESKQGPRFVDNTRNMATFDRAYLKHTSPSAWQTSHAYSVGDEVSSAGTDYGGATINYICVAAHTSNSANSTNGQPGGTTATGFRTNWEYASVKHVRDAMSSATAAQTLVYDPAVGCAAGCTYLQLVHRWVSQGFRPNNPQLWCAGSDGTTIGAVDVCGSDKAIVAAVAY